MSQYMGDIACPARILSTSVDCTNAQASIQLLQNTFANLGSPADYADSVNSLVQTFNQAWGYGIALPGTCGTVHTIGCSADNLTAQMLTEYGGADVVGPTVGDLGIQPPSLGQISAGVFALAAFAVYLLIKR